MPSAHEIIGEEWKSRSVELADWAMERLVNRKDVWGQYTVLTPSEQRKHGKSYKAMTLPQKAMRGGDKVTLDKLARHFASMKNRKPQIIGLHAKSEEHTSRWLAIDIDLHDPDDPAAEDQARRNLLAGMSWWKEFQKRGYDPLLTSSNGAGGYHLMVLFAEPAPTRDAYALGQEIVSDCESQGLVAEPETFPKSAGKEGSLGSWLRLPGMHHSREHYTTVWSGDEWLDDPWLIGHAAIDALLGVMPGPPPPPAGDIESDEAAEAREARQKKNAARAAGEAPVATKAARKKSGGSSFPRTGKPVVCVDLDGVLARHEGFQGALALGEPIAGAVEFTRELAEWAEVVILTARLGGEEVEGLTEKKKRERAELVVAIAGWLTEHGFAFDCIHEGSGKPAASAYVDDRGVSCRPQVFGGRAFEDALKDVEELCGGNPKKC